MSAGRKVGRNESCPCGSGKKYKKCCLSRESGNMRSGIERRLAEDAESRRLYGEVRPIISTEHQGRRIVAVGSRLFIDERWRSFPDFLHDYLPHVFGSGWWKKEASRPAAERHPVVQWRDKVRELRSSIRVGASGFVEIEQHGVVASYVHLAYDLYVLRHHDSLQKEVVRRLRHSVSFEGARHELFVAATFVRAGFDIDYEDEADSHTKHPEFIATHRATKLRIAVEAKSKHRGASGEDGRAKVLGLLFDAAEKATTEPLVVMIELNLHDRNALGQRDALSKEIDDSVDRVVAAHADRRLPFELLIFTNDPAQAFYAKHANTGRVPDELVEAILTAVRKYPNIPNELPANVA